MIHKHYWKPQPEAEAVVQQAAAGGAVVVDIGGSPAHRFEAATETIGWNGDRHMDFNRDRLPYGDDEIDFAYCRHTLEDLAFPEQLLREIARTAKAGYIETPSPLAELTRGVDAGCAPYRGYRHHRWLLWSHENTLYVLPKYPLVELMHDLDKASELNAGPQFWNTHHAWTGHLQWRVLQHEVDFNLAAQELRWHGPVSCEYESWLQLAQEQATQSCRAFWQSLLPQPQETVT